MSLTIHAKLGVPVAATLAMPLLKRPYVIRLTAAVLIATVLQACTSWQVPLVRPTQFRSSDKARLTLADGSTLTVLNPAIRGDSLFGNRAPSRSPVALELTRVRRMELMQPDRGKSILLAVGLGLSAVIVAAVIVVAAELRRGLG